MIKNKLNVLLFVILLAGCTSVAVTGRKQFMLIDKGQEASLGLQAYNEVLKTAKISNDAEKTQLVNKVGQRIAAVTGENFDWKFVLIDSNQVNAFCLPGGKVAVYTGILPYTQTEEGLAVVIAHEIAHALARHGAERMSQNQLLSTGLNITSLSLGQNANKDLIMAALGAGSSIGVTLPYSRKHEYEADKIGMIIMAMAGYNPQATPSFWQRMAQRGTSAPEFLSTHPSDSKRIQQIQANMAEALRYYKP